MVCLLVNMVSGGRGREAGGEGGECGENVGRSRIDM